jgi:DNA polymerase-3 subunit chi
MLVDFYHLAQSPLERVLPSICEKVLTGGERLLIVAGPEVLAQLDGLLWTYAEEAFLPHGRGDGPAPEQQPILLSSQIDPRNGATNIALADGEWREEALAFARTFYFFDNGHLDTARGAWRALKSKPEAEPRFWKQDERGKWVLGP